MALSYTLSGAQTPSGFTVSARVAVGASVRLQVSPNADMSAATFFGPVVATNGFAKVAATGLSARVRYYYRVEEAGVVDTTHTGRCWTLPAEGAAANIEWVFGSCVQNLLDPVGLIPTRANYPNSLFWLMLGDFHYLNRGAGATEQSYRDDWDSVFTRANFKALLRDMALVFVWSDHDWSLSPSGDVDGNGDRYAYNHAVAHAVYREVFPHHALGAADCIDQAFRVGELRLVLSDLRSHRDPNALAQDGSATLINGVTYTGTDTGNKKTMMGTAQKARFKQHLLDAKTAGDRAVIWGQETLLNKRRDNIPSVDTDVWGAFDDEKLEVLRFCRDNLTPPLIVCEGDRHFVAGKLNLGALGTTDNDSSNAMICHMGQIESPTDSAGQGQGWTISPVNINGIGHVAVNDPGGGSTVTVTYSALAVDAGGNVSHITGSPMAKQLVGSQPTAGAGVLYPRAAQRLRMSAAG